MSDYLPRLLLKLSYDGTDYCGWQKQPQGQSVQQELDQALKTLFPKQFIRSLAASRTDAGVHAIGQLVHVEFKKEVNWSSYPKLVRSLNSLTSSNLVIKKAYLVSPDFHILRRARKKAYRYYILNTPLPSPFAARYSLWESRPLDLERLNQLSSVFQGRHDFKSFQTKGTEVSHTIREIYKASWQKASNGMVYFHIEGSGFLKQMVRNMVGTLLDLHFSSQPPSRLKEILLQKNRQAALSTAPPQGLFLWRVFLA